MSCFDKGLSPVMFLKKYVSLMFCSRFDDCVEGGESLILDAFPVLEELREKHPEQFEILTTVPASHQRRTVLR